MRRILVPVDGSELSERAFPYASMLAQAQGATVTLVRVLEPLVWAAMDEGAYVDPATYSEVIDAIRADATDHLRRSREALAAGGVNVEAELLEGTASGALLDYESQITPDLCIIATHGRGGLARFALGSVADRLVREGTAPVLVIPAFGEGEPRLDRALVPLDGSEVSEQALPLVQELTAKPLQHVELLTALGDHTVRLPGDDDNPATVDATTAYLKRVAERIQQAGVAIETVVAMEGAVDAIEHAASGVDLVILSTHGRGGLDRLRHGSVSDQATRHLPIPRLLVRAKEASV